MKIFTNKHFVRTSSLFNKKCKPCEGGVDPLSIKESRKLLENKEVEGWKIKSYVDENGNYSSIHKNFNFKNFRDTIDFVNRVAKISHEEDHHPEMKISYKNCEVIYATHAIKGLSENDFICASKLNKI